MPKKTREQKIRAQRRHQTHILASPTAVTFEFRPTNQSISRNSEDIQELATIRIDLMRTIVLAAIAITIELVVYWSFFR